ncbi:hypothetical protein P7C73_g6651, partial [Tremellales sp. Uapishka_1]
MHFPALPDLLRRSRHRVLEDRVVWSEEDGGWVEKDYLDEKKRFYASLNDYSPAELSSLSSAAAASISRVAAANTSAESAPLSAGTTSAVGQSSSQSTSLLIVASIPSSSSPVSSSVARIISSISSQASLIVAPTSSDSIVFTTVTPSTSSPSSSAAFSSLASSSPLSNSTSEASTNTSTSSHMSTDLAGGLIGVFGLVAVVSVVTLIYRKVKSRSYSRKAPWANLPDDNVPYKNNEPKDDYDSSPPVTGRTLSVTYQNGFHSANSRRNSEMTDMGNRAGLGAGHTYPTSPVSPVFGVDVQGRPYNPRAGRTPMMHNYSDPTLYCDPEPSPAYTSPGRRPSSRQLLGPAAQPLNVPPIALGKLAPPSTDMDFARHADYADFPDAEVLPTDESKWGDKKELSGESNRLSMPGLPTHTPVSPFANAFEMNRGPANPAAETEQERQKRLYGEVAAAAGVAEPVTPYYDTTHSSFSAGNPDDLSSVDITSSTLFPLTEVPTPLGTPQAPALS